MNTPGRSRNALRRCLLPVFFAVGVLPIFPDIPTIGVVTGFVQATDADQHTRFNESLTVAVGRASTESGRVRYVQRRDSAVPRIDVIAMDTPDSRMITLTYAGPGGESDTLLIVSPWDPLLTRTLTQALRYFEPVLLGYPEPEPDRVILEDFFPLETLRAPTPGLGMMGLYPVDLALLPEGRVVVAGASFAVEFDRYFRVTGYPGSDLLEQGIFNYAGAVASTPAGTIYFRPSQGSDVYRVIDGVDRTQRLRVGLGGHGPFTVLPDGTIVTIDSINKRSSVVTGQQRHNLDLFRYPDAYLGTATSGPTGTIWAYDLTERRITIFSPEGRFVDTVIPAIPLMAAAQIVSIAVYPSGEFLLLTRAGLWKLHRDGRAIWHVAEMPRAVDTSFMQTAGVVVDPEENLIYLLDSGNRVLLRLRETDHVPPAAADAGQTPDPTADPDPIATQLQELNRELAERVDDTALLLEKAHLYEEIGATLLADATYQHALDLDPFLHDAQVGMNRVQVALLGEEADRLAEIAREQLQTLGPATAQTSYVQALQTYERILAQRPGDDAVRESMEALRRDFTPRDTPGDAGVQPLRIEGITMKNLFPGLFSAYRTRPVGEVVVTNRGDQAVEALRVTVETRRFSDFPTESVGPQTLGPGESATVPFRMILNDTVFSVEEDLPLQARVSVRGEVDNREVSVESNTGFTLYRRTALTWNETERLAGFITPNEGNVQRFALAASNAAAPVSVTGFPRTFLRAAQIADTLGLYGVLYVEDPNTPVSEILGRTDVVDTVRFPRTTLLVRAGDCDDTTTLLCSLYEAAGIPTAIVTTPDHVLMAFDTGEPPENRWLYEDAGLTVFVREGRLWLPVETTALAGGFLGAARNAARRIAEAGGVDRTGFVTTENAWGLYPTIPIPATELNIPLPPETEIQERYRGTGEGLREQLYVAARERAERAIPGLSGDALVAELSRLGALHLRFGESARAESALRKAVTEAPGALLPAINLATLYIGDGRPAEALSVLLPLHERVPHSLLINALLARASFDLGQAEDGRRYASVVESLSPELARRYGIAGEDGGARASAGIDPATFAIPSTEEDIR